MSEGKTLAHQRRSGPSPLVDNIPLNIVGPAGQIGDNKGEGGIKARISADQRITGLFTALFTKVRERCVPHFIQRNHLKSGGNTAGRGEKYPIPIDYPRFQRNRLKTWSRRSALHPVPHSESCCIYGRGMVDAFDTNTKIVLTESDCLRGMRPAFLQNKATDSLSSKSGSLLMLTVSNTQNNVSL